MTEDAMAMTTLAFLALWTALSIPAGCALGRWLRVRDGR